MANVVTQRLHDTLQELMGQDATTLCALPHAPISSVLSPHRYRSLKVDRNRPQPVSIQHADEDGVRLCDSRFREPKPHVRQVGGLPRSLEVHTDRTCFFMEQMHGFVGTGWNRSHESVRDQIDDGCPVDRAVGVKRDVQVRTVFVLGPAVRAVDRPVK